LLLLWWWLLTARSPCLELSLHSLVLLPTAEHHVLMAKPDGSKVAVEHMIGGAGANDELLVTDGTLEALLVN